MTAIAHWFMLAHGWRQAGGLLLAGALASFALPPFFVLPALFLALPIWVWSLDGAEIGRGWRRFFGAGFWIGFWFGLGYFLAALYWLGGAFFVDGGWMLVLMPLALLGLAALLALFWAFASALAHLMWTDGPIRVLILAGLLTIAEYARGHVLTGFPFSVLGYALTANEQMMQAAALVGVYGLTLAVAVMAVTPALIWPAEKRPMTRRLVPFFLALGVLGLQLGFGQYRLGQAAPKPLDNARLRLVQPNIAQAVKWQQGSGDFVLERLLSLSQTQTAAGSDLSKVNGVVWPESAFPFYLSEHPDALARMARMLPPDTLLLTGAPYLDPSDRTGATAYNAVLAIDSEGTIVSSYAKTHLVPFGEYLPFESFFARFGIKQFVAGNEGWTAGQQRRAMQPPGLASFLPLVCYEADFSGDLDPLRSRPDYLLNVTNDAWFEGTSGPQKLFHYARLRAVEEGMSLVRVANSGITGLVDPYGRITQSLPPGTAGVLDVIPDKPLAAPLFVQWRHWTLLLALIILGLSVVTERGLRRRRTALAY